MNNSFSREEVVAWEKLLEAFQDDAVMSRNVSRYSTDQQMMARTGDTIWRPQPFIALSYDGPDQSQNFKPQTQLSVPATIGFAKSSPWTMTARELRDALQADRLGVAARQRIASDINIAVLNAACAQGTLVYKSTAAASGFGDMAAIEGIMNRVGIQYQDRNAAFSTFDYNGLAKDLANRQNMVDKTAKAYERGYVGMVASFETWKMDYALRCTAQAATPTMDTRPSASNFYVPAALSTGSNGEQSNKDNRYQTITISSTAGLAAGDAFTIAGIDEVHHITHLDTGSLKTFRVISITNSTQMVISPPIISAQGTGGPNGGPQTAESQYQNCVAVTTASNAAIVFLNTAAAFINPFWQEDAIELLPGKLEIPSDAGTAVLEGVTEQGIVIQLQKWYDIKTQQILYRLDCIFGVCVKQPEMCGIALFGQT